MTDDPDFDAAVRALTDDETFDTTASIGEQEVPIRVREPDMGELYAADEEAEDEIDAARTVIDNFLVKPEVKAEDIGVTRALALYSEIRAAWRESEALAGAREEMPLDDEGNE